MFEVSGLSKKDIQEEYEDLVFRKVMAIYVENESKQILAEIKAEKESNNEPVNTKAVEKLYDKKERRENFGILWKYSKKVVSFAAMIVFVSIISLSSAVVAFADVREAVVDALYHLVFEENERYTQIGIGESTGFINPEIYDWEGAYAPTYIPEGFTVSQTQITNNDKSVMYVSDTGFFYLSQTRNLSYARIDTEDAEYVEKLFIGNSEAFLVYENEIVSLVWVCGETYISIDGMISIEEAVSIANGIKIKN